MEIGENFILGWFLSSQFTVNQLDSSIVFLGQILQFQCSFFQKDLNIVIKIDVVKLVLSIQKDLQMYIAINISHPDEVKVTLHPLL